MPSKKKKYNARFPAGRIKKIMQSDEEIGKVAQAVPVIISRTLELFVESLLKKTLKVTNSRNAKTLSPSHMKQCIMSEQRFDFLRELVKSIPDISVADETANEEDVQSSPEEQYACDSDTPFDLSMPSTSNQARRFLANGAAAQLPQQRCVRATTTAVNSRRQSQNETIADEALHKRTQRKRESDILQRLQQRVGITSTVTSSNHIAGAATATQTIAATLTADCLPPKLYRSESTPTEAVAAIGTAMYHHIWTAQQQQQHNKILLQQQQHFKNNNNNNMNNSITTKMNNSTAATQKLATIVEDTAIIPAPIVNFDFCSSKPVVKIDYSNLDVAAIAAAPHSAPANMAHGLNNTNFDFNAAAAPIISIDLSNIGITAAATATATAAAAPPPPPLAKISIAAAAQITKSETNAAASAVTSNISFNSSNSKIKTMAAPYISTQNNNNNSNNATANNNNRSVAATASSLTTKNSFLELDEDYDNI